MMVVKNTAVSIKLDEWRRLVLINFEPLFNRIRIVILTLNQTRAACITYIRLFWRNVANMIIRCTLRTNAPACETFDHLLFGGIKLKHKIDGLVLLRKHRLKCFGLLHSSGEPIQNEAAGRIRPQKPLADHLNDQLIRNQFSIFNERLCFLPARRFLLNLGAKQIPCRNMWQLVPLIHQLGVRSFACSGRS